MAPRGVGGSAISVSTRDAPRTPRRAAAHSNGLRPAIQPHHRRRTPGAAALGVSTPRAVNALASPLSVATPAARTSAITGRRSVARAVAGFNFLPGGGGRVTSRQPRRFRVILQEDLLMLPIMGALAFPAAAGAQSSTASDLGPWEYQK